MMHGNLLTQRMSLVADQSYNPYDPFQYPWMCLNFFLAFWFVSGILRKVLYSIKATTVASRFHLLPEDKKRNVVTYILQFGVTSLAFVLQIYGATDVLFRLSDETTSAKFHSMILAVVCLAVLYTWELCYREKIGWPLLLHHVIALFLVQGTQVSFYETNHFFYIRYVMLLGFHATTEQISFLALFCFRLGIVRQHHSTLFFVAAIQSLVFKTIVTVAALVLVVVDVFVNNGLKRDPTRWGTFWKVFLLPSLAALYATQVYASKILYGLGKRCQEASRIEENTANESLRASTPHEVSKIFEKGAEASRRQRHASLDILDDFENSKSIRSASQIAREISNNATKPDIETLHELSESENALTMIF